MRELESAADELVREFNIISPPIPVEGMLQQPRDGMWEELDISQLTVSFLRVNERYAPRMSMARLLVRHLVKSPWGKARGLDRFMHDEKALYAFARMIVMPACMILEIKPTVRTSNVLSTHFEVPEEEARLRLEELATSLA